METHGDTPRTLTIEELWACWDPEPKTVDEDHITGLKGPPVDDNNAERIYQEPRQAYYPSSLETLRNQRANRQFKLKLYKDIVSFYGNHGGESMYIVLWEDLHSPAVTQVGIQKRMEKIIIGKEAGTAKYKERNFFGAMYNYIMAWGLFIPYHVDAFAEDDPIRSEMGKLECALLVNITAAAMEATQNCKCDYPDMRQVLEIGIKAAKAVISLSPYASVASIQKACRRAAELKIRLVAIDPKYPRLITGDAEIREWLRVVDILKGMPGTRMYREVMSEIDSLESSIPKL